MKTSWKIIIPAFLMYLFCANTLALTNSEINDLVELCKKHDIDGMRMIVALSEEENAIDAIVPGVVYSDSLGSQKDYKQKDLILRMAKENDFVAQYILGNMYSDGQYVEQNYALATGWFCLAAEQGYAPAQTNLGNMYFDGLGINQNYVEAAAWYQKAADQDDINGQLNLGNSYYKGLGVQLSYPLAIKWYRKAAEKGNVQAQANLGIIYGEEGNGVQKNYIEAIKWYRKAANQGDDGALNNLGIMYEEGRGVKASRVIAYSLYIAARANNSSESHTNIMLLEEKLSPKELVTAEELSNEMQKPGNFLAALDKYIANPKVKEQIKKVTKKH